MFYARFANYKFPTILTHNVHARSDTFDPLSIKQWRELVRGGLRDQNPSTFFLH